MYKGTPREPNRIYDLADIPKCEHWVIFTPEYDYNGDADPSMPCGYFAYILEDAWKSALEDFATKNRKFRAMRINPVELKITTTTTVEVLNG